jgi:hypothetical protein
MDALDVMAGQQALNHTVRQGDCIVYTRAPEADNPRVVVRSGGRERSIRLPRAAWIAWNGSVPRGQVRTTCGNPRCVSPEHLVLHVNADVEMLSEVQFVREGGRTWHEIEKATGCALPTLADKLTRGGPAWRSLALDARRELRARGVSA